AAGAAADVPRPQRQAHPLLRGGLHPRPVTATQTARGWARKQQGRAALTGGPASSPFGVFTRGPGTESRPPVREKLHCEAPTGVADPITSLAQRVDASTQEGG